MITGMSPHALLMTAALLAAVQGRVTNRGQVATPTTFGKIHVFLPVAHFKANCDDLEGLADRVQEVTASSTSETIRREGQRLSNQSRGAARSLRKESRRLSDILFRNDTDTAAVASVREKRAAALALSVVGGVSLGVGLAALSFAAANRADLEHLEAELAKSNERVDALISTVEANNDKMNDDLKTINATILDLARALDEQESSAFLETCRTRLRTYTILARRKQADYERALYSAFAGHLDPALVPLPKLQSGLASVERYGAAKGLKIVESMAVLETAFSMPLTVITNATGLSLIIEVPMIPMALEPLDLLEASHTPMILDPRAEVNLDFGTGMVIADPQRRFHREVSAAEISLCPKFKNWHFCGFRQLQKKPTTCLAAYILHDRPVVTALCQKTIKRSTFAVSDSADGGMQVSSQGDVVFRQECPHNATLQSVYRTGGEKVSVDLAPGCYLDTPELAFFGSGQAVDAVEVVEPEIDVEDLLEGISKEQAAAAVHAIAKLKNLETLELPLDAVVAHVRGEGSQAARALGLTVAYFMSGTSLGLCLMIYSCIGGRVLLVYCRRRRALMPGTESQKP